MKEISQKMITIKDVAEKAGVSVATVSRVMNRKGALSDKTIKLVEEAIDELGYVPNSNARALVGARTNCLGCIISTFSNPFHAELAQQIVLHAKERGMDVLFTFAIRNSEIEQGLKYLLSHQVSGILYVAAFGEEAERVLQENCTVPYVFLLNRSLRGACCVYSDDAAGGVAAAEHLTDRGCTRLVHISGKKKKVKTGDQRTYSFLEKCRERGVKCKAYENPYMVEEEDKLQNLVERVFEENPDMDGMFLSNDVLAALCVKEALSRGIKVPEQIKIMGYDGVMLGSLVHPMVTTVKQDLGKLADVSLQRLTEMIEGKETEQITVLPVELIVRQST